MVFATVVFDEYDGDHDMFDKHKDAKETDMMQ